MIIYVAKGPIGSDGRPVGFYVGLVFANYNFSGEFHEQGTRLDTGEPVIVSTGDDRRPLEQRTYLVTEVNGPGAFAPTYPGEFL